MSAVAGSSASRGTTKGFSIRSRFSASHGNSVSGNSSGTLAQFVTPGSCHWRGRQSSVRPSAVTSESSRRRRRGTPATRPTASDSRHSLVGVSSSSARDLLDEACASARECAGAAGRGGPPEPGPPGSPATTAAGGAARPARDSPARRPVGLGHGSPIAGCPAAAGASRHAPRPPILVDRTLRIGDFSLRGTSFANRGPPVRSPQSRRSEADPTVPDRPGSLGPDGRMSRPGQH